MDLNLSLINTRYTARFLIKVIVVGKWFLRGTIILYYNSKK